MTQECWEVVIDTYLADKDRGLSDRESKDRYKRDYEQKALERLISVNPGAP